LPKLGWLSQALPPRWLGQTHTPFRRTIFPGGETIHVCAQSVNPGAPPHSAMVSFRADLAWSSSEGVPKLKLPPRPFLTFSLPAKSDLRSFCLDPLFRVPPKKFDVEIHETSPPEPNHNDGMVCQYDPLSEFAFFPTNPNNSFCKCGTRAMFFSVPLRVGLRETRRDQLERNSDGERRLVPRIRHRQPQLMNRATICFPPP